MSFPDDDLCPVVGIAYGADKSADPDGLTYTDESEYAQAVVVISRGRADEQSQAATSECAFGLRNPEGRFSQRNPLGPNYGLFGANTPIRIELDAGTAFGSSVRYSGQVPGFEPRWTAPETDEHAALTASGVLRRLDQGDSPLHSALRQSTLAAINNAAPVAYWPLEDGPESAIPDVPALTVIGEIEFGQDDSCPGSAALPGSMVDSGGSLLSSTLDATTDGDDPWQLEAVLKWSPSGQLLVMDLTGAPFWDYVEVRWDDTLSPDELQFRLVQLDTGVTAQVDFLADAHDLSIDVFHHIAVRVATSAGTTVLRAWVDGVEASTSFAGSATGIPKRIKVPAGEVVSVGHITLYTGSIGSPAVFMADAATGYDGELTGDRFERLCTEQSVPFDVAAGSVVTMGPQRPATLLDLLRQCEASEAGVMLERRSGHLGFDPPAVVENQAVALTLDYEAGHIKLPDWPKDDDQLTRNDVTITRIGGSSTQLVDEDGPKGTDPMTGVGRYDHAEALSLETDAQTSYVAGTLLNRGTVDAPRWPRITLELHNNSELIDQWLACDRGSRVHIDNLPVAYLGDSVAELVIEGYIEVFDAPTWTVELNLAPFAPYGIFEIASDSGDTSEFVGRLIPDMFHLSNAQDADDVELAAYCDPPFTLLADDFPVELRMSGELIEASDCERIYDDTFTRTEVDSWGSATPTGQAYVLTGAAANFDVAGGLGTIRPTVADFRYFALIDAGAGWDMDVTGVVSLNALPSSSAVIMGFTLRSIDDDDFLMFALSVTDLGVIAPTIAYRIAGGTLEAAGSGGLHPNPRYVPGDQWAIRAVIADDPDSGAARLRMRAWPAGKAEPAHWMVDNVNTDLVNLHGTMVGTFVRSLVDTTLIVSFDRIILNSPQRFTAVRAVNGVPKSHAAGTEIEIEHPYVLGL
jgi:hypothetical protein